MIPQVSFASMSYNFARSYSRANRLDKSYESLIKALNTGWTCSEKLETDEAFENLKKDKRFISLIQSVKIVECVLGLEQGGDRNLMKEALKKSCELSAEYAYPRYLLARLIAMEKGTSEALEHLAEAVRLGFKNFCVIMGEPAFSHLRGFTEFQQIMRLSG